MAIHEAKIEERELKYKHIGLLKDDLAHYNGKKVSVTIKLWSSTRTPAQNNYLWLYYNLIEKETGNLAADVHEYCKRTLLSPVTKKFNGKEFIIPRSTTSLDKLQFSDYINKIEQLTGIPAPPTQQLDQLEDYVQ